MSESLDRVTFVDGRLDEVVGSRAHLEHLDGNRWFLVVGHDDGTESAFWFSSKNLRKPYWETRPPRKTLTNGDSHGDD